MAGNTVTLTFAGDSKSLERTFSNVGDGAKRMGKDFDKAGADTKQFGKSLDGVNDTVDASEGKFMATADLLDGLGEAFGLPIGGAVGMARAFGDMASGVTGVVIPAVQGILSKLGIMTTATAAQTAATGAATTAQTGLNAALLANPVGLIVAGIVALGAALVLAWKHSETFRNIVKGAFNIVKGAAEGFWNFLRDLPGKILGIADKLKDAVTAPFKAAFNAIAGLWNNTVGKLSFELPGWVPGLGGKGFSMPKLPTFHNGGVVPGNPGVPVPILALGGERVSRAAESGSVVHITVRGSVITERDLGRIVADAQRSNRLIGVS